jgi:hypothetical protein
MTHHHQANRFIFIALLSLASYACTARKESVASKTVTPSSSRSSSRTSSSVEPSKATNLSMEGITTENAVPETKDSRPARKDKKPRAKRKNIAGKIRSCEHLLARFQPHYQRLASHLAEKGKLLESPISAFTDMPKAACRDLKQRKKALRALVLALNKNRGKIGMILPLTGANSQASAFIIEGLKAALNSLNLTFEDSVILRDNQSLELNTHKALAEFVLVEKVTVIVGGFSLGNAKLLSQYAKDLLLPTLLLTKDRSQITESPYVFTVFPDLSRLSKSLALTAVQKGVKRVAILRPANHKSDQLIDFFAAHFSALGGVIVSDISYARGQFDSMQVALKKMFQVDIADRKAEYTLLYDRAKRRAKQSGQVFNPKMVILKPIVNFDAVFIPDDFRSVRHFAKLFRYHGAAKIPIFGNHEWRSKALVEPFDDYLDGAFFADFIGSYLSLPSSLRVATDNSPYFVHSKDIVPLDFRLIGYRIGRISALALLKKDVGRRHLAKAYQLMESDEGSFFGSGPLFDDKGTGHWPVFIFRVAEGKIILDRQLDFKRPSNSGKS